jgi:SPP1 gp7 family putative phage head morphogenesis protein
MADWDDFLARESMLPERYYSLSNVEKLRAFSFMNAAGMEQIKFVQKQLGDVIKNGGTLNDFKNMVRSGELALELPDYRIQNIFRTNVMSAYGRGRYMEQNESRKDYGWYQYHTNEDPKVRPNHAALNKLIVRFGSEEGNQIYPPNGYQCRCWTQMLTEAQAMARRTKSEVETRAIISANPPDNGFDGAPLDVLDVNDPRAIAGVTKYQSQAVRSSDLSLMIENGDSASGRVVSEALFREVLADTVNFQRALTVQQTEVLAVKRALGEEVVEEVAEKKVIKDWAKGDPIDVTRRLSDYF